MTRELLQPRGLARLTVLCLPVVATLVLPSVAIAASGGSTVRATIGGDGAVTSVKVYAPGAAASDFTGTIPLKLSISRTVSGSTSTYHYHVENTFSKQQTVTYTDTAGKSHSTTAELQLPLVAQLGIQLPNTFKEVTAPGGVIQTDPDGVNRVLFNLVLFSPLGAPAQDVTFTATGSGSPTAELAATAVNPASTAGLSQASQDANASGQQDDFWASFASGGNTGLTQLATGVEQMVTGLDALAPGAHQLADGIKAAGAGAVKLDAGTKSAYDGSKQIASGTKDAHAGSTQLSTGLGEISGGLAALDSRSTTAPGLPAAEDGLAQLLVGFEGVGGTSTAPKIIPKAVTGATNDSLSILLGIDDHAPATYFATDPGGLEYGLKAVQAGLQPLASGLDCAQDILTDVLNGTASSLPVKAGTTDPCYKSAANPTGTVPLLPAQTDPFVKAVLGAMVDKTSATGIYQGAVGLHSVVDNPDAAFPSGGALFQMIFGVDHAAGTLTPTLSATDPNYDKGGLRQVLQGVTDGVSQLHDGVAKAVAGLDQLAPGAASAYTGSKTLDSGLGQLQTGTASLSSGLAELSAGQHSVATGLPTAVSGSAQLAAGADQLKAGAVAVHDGILAVQSGAVGPLLTQITQGSQNAKKQLAILDAAGALAAQAPGGAGTAYVLSQSPNGFRLAASTSSSGGSNTGRNIGIGLGGLVALVIAVTAGFALGRRSSVSA
jgi:putative membrane protein